DMESRARPSGGRRCCGCRRSPPARSAHRCTSRCASSHGPPAARRSRTGSAGIDFLQVAAHIVAGRVLIQRNQLIGALAPAVVQEAALLETARAAAVAAMLGNPELAV